MKKNILFISILLISTFSFAKKVKFAVDMRGQVLLSTGVHITGDFQTLAGFSGGDWMSNTTPLTRETIDTNIFSIIVDIPAFAKYEYKFLNGDQFYETEFVPFESRVGYDFNDNRWLYVDSLANDTTFVGAIRFSQNAPLGQDLVRFKVNMTDEIVSSFGVHLSSSFQSWNSTTTRLYSFQDNVYEYIAYVDSNSLSFQYIFVNGNTSGEYELVPSSCAVFDNREINFVNDTVLNTVCFSSCSDCINSTGIDELRYSNSVHMYPNPMSSSSILIFNDRQKNHSISIYNTLGKSVRTYSNYSESTLQIEKNELEKGIYTILITDSNGNNSTIQRLIIQ